MRKTISFAAILIILLLFSVTATATAPYSLNTLDLRIPCGYSIKELENGLLKGLVPLADQFIFAERYYGVNAVFLAAVAALESGWAEKGWSSRNNIFGYDNGKRFDSKEQCIFYVANALRTNYLSTDGIYHRGYTIDSVNYYYNGRSVWAAAVKRIMNEITHRIEAYKAQ